MARPALGGDGPAVKLFHYGGVMQGAIRKDSYWTDFESTNKEDVSRITGQPAIYFKYRTTVLVNRAKLDQYFRNVATAMKPGLPASDEYRNKAEVPASYLESIPLP